MNNDKSPVPHAIISSSPLSGSCDTTDPSEISSGSKRSAPQSFQAALQQSSTLSIPVGLPNPIIPALTSYTVCGKNLEMTQQQQLLSPLGDLKSINPCIPIRSVLLAPLKRADKNLTEKKIRRLEKNRLSARNCRRKKKEYTQSLQREINVLEGENLRLRLQLKIGQESEKISCDEQEQVMQGLNLLLKSKAPDAEIHARIEEFKERFADYGRDRRSALEFHLRNVERLLTPTQTTSVCMRALEGGSGNSSSIIGHGLIQLTEGNNQSSSALRSDIFPFDSKNLFEHLVKYLGVTPSQASALKDSRNVARELDMALEHSLGMLKKLHALLTDVGEDLEAEFTQIRKTLTPRQAAKFLVWVANNRACMYMLNELWDKVYQDPVANEMENDERNW